MAFYKIKSGRVTGERGVLTYVGEIGHLFYSQDDNTIRISDGHTPGGIPLSGGSITFISVGAPPNPQDGQLWFDPVTGRLYVWYDNHWVDASPDIQGAVTSIIAGTGISIDQSTGAVTISATGGGGGISLTDLSVGAPNTASGSGAISYNNTNGQFKYTPPDLSSYVNETFVNNAIDQVKDRLVSPNNLHTVVLANTGVTTFGGDAIPSNPSYSLGTLTNPWKDVVVSDGSLIMKDSNPGVDPLYWANHLGFATLSRGGLKVRDNTNTHEIFQLDPSGKLILKSEQPLLSSSAAVQLIGNLSGNLLDPYNLGVMLQATGTQDIPSRVYIDGIGTQNDGTSAYAAFVGRHARGTSDTPTAVQAGDIIVRFGGNAYASTLGLDSKTNVRIDMVATENQTSTARGTEIQFWTTLNGTTVTEPTAHLNYQGLDFSNATSELVGITFKDSSRLTYFPSQSGKDGKYLKVVGTTMTWADIPTLTGAVIFKGTWDAFANTPTIADNTGTQGWEWIVGTAGTQDLGSGPITFAVGDLVIHDGTKYQLVQATSAPQVNADWNALSGVAQILNKPTLATVATSGSYTDLSNKPTIPAAQINVDWNATTGVAQILNKPTIPAAQVQSDWTQSNNAYPDYIKNKPTIPAAQLQSDWNQTNNASLDFIKNKPTLFSGAYADLTGKPTLFSGSYTDLTNKPTIPAAQIQSDWNQTNNASLDFIKNKPTIPAAQVNSDWNATTGVAQILNKPTLLTTVTPTTLNSTTHVVGSISSNTLTLSTDATTANTPSTIVVRDTNGNINVGAWTINTVLTGVSYVISATDYWIGCTAKNLTITLPQTASQGRQYIIVDTVQSGAPGDTIVAAGGTRVVGGGLTQQGQSKMCVFHSGTWYCN